MKYKDYVSVALSVLVSVMVVGGVAYASSVGNAVEPYPGQGTVKFDSLRVGDITKGGVLFGNGTWVNEGGALTIGDHLRVDGNIHRGPEHGINKNDNKPLRFNDEVVSMGKHTFDNGIDFAGGSANFANATVENFPGYDHDHNGSYYTKSEIDTQMSTKANSDSVVSKSSPEWDAHTSYLSVPYTAFHISDDSLSYGRVLSSGDGGLYTDYSGGGTAVFAADVTLPHGAVVTGATAYAKDDDVAKRIQLIMAATPKNPYNAASFETVVQFDTGTTFANSSVSSFSPSVFNSHTVDNSSKFYVASLLFDDASTNTDLVFTDLVLEYIVTQPN